LADLSHPGSTSTTQRVFLQTCPPANKREEDGKEIWEDAEEYENLFEDKRTYIHLSFEVSEPVVP
jgi:hypothetical protein